jgi:rod shape-determining protein MreC
VARPRRSRRTLVVVIVLVLLSVTLITFDERAGTSSITSGIKSVAHDVFSPIIAGVNDVLRPIGDFFAGAVHYGALQSENQRLQAMIGQLQLQLGEVQAASKQDEELRRLAHLPFLPAAKTVTAQMISFNLSDFDADIWISKGRDEGVMVGEAVVAAGGLVGKVVEASHGTSEVELVTDPASSVGLAYGRSDQLYAEAFGQGAGRALSVNFIPVGTALRRGEAMYTNGLQGAAFPAGIPVGVVRSFHAGVGGASMVVTLTPLANLSELAYVDVIQSLPNL